MPLDNFVNKDMLLHTRKEIENQMKEEIIQTKEIFSNDTAGMGAFTLEYYLPSKEFLIIFEYQKMHFNIDIYNKDEEKISLGEICSEILKCEFGQKESDWILDKDNIKKAIEALSMAVNDEELYFYIYRDGKVYKHEGERITRIKY